MAGWPQQDVPGHQGHGNKDASHDSVPEEEGPHRGMECFTPSTPAHFFLESTVKASDGAAQRLLKPLHYPALVRAAPAALAQSTRNYFLLIRCELGVQSFPCFRIYLGFLDPALSCRKSGLFSPSLPKRLYFYFVLEQGPACRLREANCFRRAGVC